MSKSPSFSARADTGTDHSSAMNAREKVESNKDILVEILTFLPPKSIFRFMCVSKRWENIMKNPFFLRSYSCRRRSYPDGGRLLALFQRSASPFLNPGMIKLACKNPTNMLTINRTSWGDRIDNMPRQFGRFITSSNGLILCSPNEEDVHHYVVNPATGKSVTLPPPPPLPESSRIYPPYEYNSMGLMCEENTSELKPNFIVIRAFTRISRCCGGDRSTERKKYNSMQMQTYSSMTGEWTLSTLVASDRIALLCEPPMVVNGVFYWPAHERNIVVYDPKNKDQNKVQLIQVPYRCLNSRMGQSPDGILWLSTINVDKKRIELWMLGEDGGFKTIAKDEWILKYIIPMEDYKSCISFEGFISWDPIVVLLHFRKLEKLLLYNVESESIVETVEHDGALGLIISYFQLNKTIYSALFSQDLKL